MVFKIIWTAKAQNDRIEILQYWIDRNKSTLFATKLNEIFNECVELLSQYPNLGKKTNMKQIRAHSVGYSAQTDPPIPFQIDPSKSSA